MGFFDRSRKVKKTAPAPPPATAAAAVASPPPPPPPPPRLRPRLRNDRGVAPPQYQSRPLPLPPREPPAQSPYANGGGVYHHSQPAFQPAGLLPSPPGWSGAGPSPPPPPYEPSRAYAPIIVNQHYYLTAPTSFEQLPRPHTSSGGGGGGPISLGKAGLDSVVNLVDGLYHPHQHHHNHHHGPGGSSLAVLHGCHTHAPLLCHQDTGLYDEISHRFNDVMTRIDRDRYHGHERELFVHHEPETSWGGSGSGAQTQGASSRDAAAPRRSKKHQSNKDKDQSKGQAIATAAAAATASSSSGFSGHYFAKVELYANSRLPMNLPPLKLYVPTYPLLCLAAQYSNRVYQKPKGTERDTYIDADWRSGTKATYIKSVPMDDMNTIVFAIRGTASFMDWAVNLDTAPTSPAGFLDDPGNHCHAGFLSVAQKMVGPVAVRLRQLLEEKPGRSAYSLLITGHSAGGAIASLLYCHMLSTTRAAQSELTRLTGRFRRIHCVTFGTPPVSLLPLAKPAADDNMRKSLFLSFVNEGDPVARADRAYVKSLLELLAAPVPGAAQGSNSSGGAFPPDGQGSDHSPSSAAGRSSSSNPKEKEKKSKTSSSGKPTALKTPVTGNPHHAASPPKPIWPVPPCTLSNPGRIVVLRSGAGGRAQAQAQARAKGKKTVEERLNEGVVAHVATDEQLRGVIWGDPVAHVMKLYSGRIETLAIGAVTAKGY